MNYYKQRIAQLDRETLPKEVFSDGRDNRTSNEAYWKKIKMGTKVFPTVWFLRDIDEVEKVAEIAKNGLTVVEKGYINDPYGEWKMGNWRSCKHNCLFFEEISRPMSFKYVISQQIWKIE
jgi:hypothetical protein